MYVMNFTISGEWVGSSQNRRKPRSLFKIPTAYDIEIGGAVSCKKFKKGSLGYEFGQSLAMDIHIQPYSDDHLFQGTVPQNGHFHRIKAGNTYLYDY